MSKQLYISLDISSNNIKGVCNGIPFTLEHILTNLPYDIRWSSIFERTTNSFLLKDEDVNSSFLLLGEHEPSGISSINLVQNCPEVTNICDRIKLGVVYGILSYLASSNLDYTLSNDIFVLIGWDDSLLLETSSEIVSQQKMIAAYFEDHLVNMRLYSKDNEKISFKLTNDHLFFIPITIGAVLNDRADTTECQRADLYITLTNTSTTMLLVNDDTVDDFLSCQVLLPEVVKLTTSTEITEGLCDQAAEELIKYIRENMFTLNAVLKRIVLNGECAELLHPLVKENMISKAPYFFDEDISIVYGPSPKVKETSSFASVWGLYNTFKDYIQYELESEVNLKDEY